MTPTEPIRGTPDGLSPAADLKSAALSAKLLKMAMIAYGYGGGFGYLTNASRSGPPVKPCLACGKPKQHNNEFCSAECCRAWKKK